SFACQTILATTHKIPDLHGRFGVPRHAQDRLGLVRAYQHPLLAHRRGYQIPTFSLRAVPVLVWVMTVLMRLAQPFERGHLAELLDLRLSLVFEKQFGRDRARSDGV